MSLLNNSVLGSNLRAHAGPILCYLTDRGALHGKPQTGLIEAILEKIGSLAAAGVDWIQLREKDLTGKDLASLTREAVVRISNQAPHGKAVTRHPSRILVNDRLDVALAEHAGGVHLSENSLPPEEAKRLSGLSPPPRKIPAARFSPRRLLPFARGRQIRRLCWRRLHFLRPRLRHALKSRLWCASGPRSSRSGLQLREHSCTGHRRNHSGKRFLLPVCRRIRHRRHPPVSGFRRSHRTRGRNFARCLSNAASGLRPSQRSIKRRSRRICPA